MESQIKSELSSDFSYDYAGSSRQFKQEGNTFLITLLFSIVFIFLVLAAQFESFRDPLVILTSVPLSTCGALIFLFWGIGGSNLNIYTQVGLITLIGLISKHGILMVDFANVLQTLGRNQRDAIIESATIRLRPIIMTTAAMILGVLPLLLASGAGAMSRFNIGLVITTGMFFGTGFTLFVVPAMYLLIAKPKLIQA